MNIYYINNHYPEKRCVIQKAIGEKYIPVGAVAPKPSIKNIVEKIQHAFAHRYSAYQGEKTLSCYWFMKRKGVIHTFNSCISGSNKWVCTFESIVPRTNYTRLGMSDAKKLDRRTLRQFKSLAKENCLACMALSHATYNLQMSALDKMGDCLTKDEVEAIRNKTIVLHPPQELMITQDEIVRKFREIQTLEFIFVGHDFFRKGGKELLDCLLAYKEQYSFHLTVVSSMNYGDYASYATREEMEQYKELLQKESWVTFYETLTNEQVLELCKKAHIGLLPTMADTYGYSVLEMQACGCAMLTTDIRSLPEINNKDCGWICHLPQSESREAFYRTEEERITLKTILSKQLADVLKEILESDTKQLQQKALNAWERVGRQNNPQKYSNTLKEVWNR